MNIKFLKLLSPLFDDGSLKDEAADILRENQTHRRGARASSAERGFMAGGESSGLLREEVILAQLIDSTIEKFRDAKLSCPAPEYWNGCRKLAADMPEDAAMRLAAIAFRERLPKAKIEGKLWQTRTVSPALTEKAAAVRTAVLRKRLPVSRESMLNQLEVFQAAREQRLH